MLTSISKLSERQRIARIACLSALGSILAFVAMALFFAAPAGAETIEPSATVIDVPSGALLSISPVILAVLAGTVVPILNGILLKTNASSGVGAVLNLVTTAVITVVNFVLTQPTFDVSTVVILFVTTFATAITSYYGLWKPIAAGGDRAPGAGALGVVGPSGP